MSKPVTVTNINGTLVALYPMKSVGNVAVKGMLRAGSWYEPGTMWGGMHLLEHMVHNGTNAFPNRDSIELFKESNGIYQNATTGGEFQSYEMNFPNLSLKEGLHLFHELVFKPHIPEKELAREKSVIDQEYKDKWSNPNSRFWRANNEYLYGKDHIYVRDGMGIPEYFNAQSTSDLQKLHSEFFTPSNLVIAISGNFSEKRALTMLEKILHKDTGVKKDFSASPANPQGSYLWHKEDGDRVAININYFVPGQEIFSFSDRIALFIFSYLLGGSSRSVLHKKLRLEMGAVYSTDSYFSFSRVFSDFTLGASTSHERVAEVHEVMLKEFHNFLNKGVTKEAFERAKKFIMMRTLMSFDSPYQITNILVSQLFQEQKIYSLEEQCAMIESLTYEQVWDLARHNINPKPIVTLMSREDPKLVV